MSKKRIGKLLLRSSGGLAVGTAFVILWVYAHPLIALFCLGIFGAGLGAFLSSNPPYVCTCAECMAQYDDGWMAV